MTPFEQIKQIMSDRTLTDEIRSVRVDEVLDDAYWRGYETGRRVVIGTLETMVINMKRTEEDR